MWLGRIRDVYPEHGPMGRNQDAVAFFVDIDDGAVKALVFGRAGGRDQADEEESREDSESSRTYV